MAKYEINGKEVTKESFWNTINQNDTGAPTFIATINMSVDDEKTRMSKLREGFEGYSTRHKAGSTLKSSEPLFCAEIKSKQEEKIIQDWEKKEDYTPTLNKEYTSVDEALLNFYRDEPLDRLLKLKDEGSLHPSKKKAIYSVLVERSWVPGKKESDGKLPMDKMISIQFPKALEAICRATLFGHNKYKDFDIDFLNFKRVEGGSQTYADALQRHNLSKSDKDSESGLPHIFHKAWNALAELELWIEENELKQK